MPFLDSLRRKVVQRNFQLYPSTMIESEKLSHRSYFLLRNQLPESTWRCVGWHDWISNKSKQFYFKHSISCWYLHEDMTIVKANNLEISDWLRDTETIMMMVLPFLFLERLNIYLTGTKLLAGNRFDVRLFWVPDWIWNCNVTKLAT